MKPRELLRHLNSCGCTLLREGGNYKERIFARRSRCPRGVFNQQSGVPPALDLLNLGPKLGEHVSLSGADGDDAKNYEEKNVATAIQNAQKAK